MCGKKYPTIFQNPCPRHAVKPVYQVLVGKMLPFSDIFRSDADHLFSFQAFFKLPLMIAAAGIGAVLVDLHDTMQHKSAAVPAVEGQIIFLQVSRDGRQGAPVAVANDKGIHTCPRNRQGKGAAIVQGLFDERIIVGQLYFIQGSQLLPVWR